MAADLRAIWTPWERQPTPDVGPNRNDPINARLAFLWTGYDAQFERVNNAFATTRNAAPTVGKHGSGIQCSTGQANLEWSRQFITTSDGAGTGDFTMLVLAAPTVGGGAVQHIFAQKNDAAGSPFAQVAIQANANNAGGYSSGSLGFLTFNGGSSGAAFAGGIDGNPHVFVAVRLGGFHYLYIDGREVANTFATVRNILQSAARYTAVGSRGNGTTEAMSGPANSAAAWNRGLSADEIRELGRPENLWRLFEPQRIWVPVSAGGGTTYTITPSGGFTLSGTAALLRERVQVPSGGFSLSGTVPLLRTRAQIPAGGVVFAGTAPITFAPAAGGTTYTITPSGGFALSGTAALLRTRVQVPDGGVVFGGTAPLIRERTSIPVGGVVFGGSVGMIFIPAGGLPASADSRITVGVGRSTRLS